jgi:hypothetical protein
MSIIRAEMTEQLRRLMPGSNSDEHCPAPFAVEDVLLQSLRLAGQELTLKIRHKLPSELKTPATHRQISLLFDSIIKVF